MPSTSGIALKRTFTEMQHDRRGIFSPAPMYLPRNVFNRLDSAISRTLHCPEDATIAPRLLKVFLPQTKNTVCEIKKAS